MTGDQLRMARALLRMTTRELADAANVNKNVIVRIEAGRRGHAATVSRLKEALIARGVIFIGVHEDIHEPCVAMRFGMKPPVVAEREDAAEDEEDADMPEQETKPWDEADAALDAERIDELREYWASDPDRWRRLSEPSRKALSKTFGGPPV